MKELMRRLDMALLSAVALGMICASCGWYSKGLSTAFTKWDFPWEETMYSRLASLIAVERMRLTIDTLFATTAQIELVRRNETVVQIENMRLSVKCQGGQNTFFVKRIELSPVAQQELIKLDPSALSSTHSPSESIDDSSQYNGTSLAYFELDRLTTYLWTTSDLKSVFLSFDTSGDTSLLLWKAEFVKISFQSPQDCPLDSIDMTGLDSSYKVRINLKPIKGMLSGKSWVGCIHEFGHMTDSAYISDSSIMTGCK